MRRKFILVFVGLLILGTATFFYIDTVFLPIQLKRFVTLKASTFLKRQVSIGAVDFHPIKGFIVENIAVARKDDPNRPFIQARQITFNVLLVPIFLKKVIIIPAIKIKDPFLYFGRDEKGIWNFADLPNDKEALKHKSSYPLIFRKLDLEGGKIHYADKTHPEDFSEFIEGIHINSTLSLNKGIRFIVEAQIPNKKSALQIKGSYNLLAKALTAQCRFDYIDLAQYLTLAYPSRPYLYLKDGAIPSADLAVTYKNHELKIEGDFTVDQTNLHVGQNQKIAGRMHIPDIRLTWRDKKWDMRGRILIPSAHITGMSNTELSGNITADFNPLTIFNNQMVSRGDVTIEEARLKIDKHTYFNGDITATNTSLIKKDGHVYLKGNFDVQETDFVVGEWLSLQGHFSTMGTTLTWSPKNEETDTFNIQSNLNLDAAQIVLGEHTLFTGDIDVPKASLLYENKKVTVEAQGQVNATHLHHQGNKQFHGSPYLNISYSFDSKSKNPIDYKGDVHFTKSQLAGIPHLNEINNLAGTLNITPDHIETKGLKFNSQETAILFSGVLKNFAKPELDLKASSDSVLLEKVLPLFPVFGKKIKADFTGEARVDASYTGPMHSPADAAIKLTAQLSDTTIIHERLNGDVTNVSGQLIYENDSLAWDGLHADYQNKTYLLNGTLNDFSRPAIDLALTGDQLQLEAQIKILRSAFQLTSFAGDYLNSHFDLKGDVHLFEDVDADIDLRGKVALDLGDIGLLVPRLKHKAKQFNPIGVLAGEGIYRGKFKDWRNWQLVFDAVSDSILLKDYPFEDVSIRFTQRDMTINKCNVSAKVYGGSLSVTSSADLRSDEIPFDIDLDLKDFDLAEFRKDKKPSDRHLSGNLTLSTSLTGEGDHWRESSGEGSLTITDGYLWQWNILEGISSALLIPEFKNLVFTEAAGHFVLRDQKIFTNDTQMTSTSATLTGKGWIDFDKNIYFDITPTFSEIAILESDSLKKGPTSILTQTEGYLNIKLTGTLDDPKFDIEKFPLKIIEDTIGETTDTLKGVIGDIIDEIF